MGGTDRESAGSARGPAEGVGATFLKIPVLLAAFYVLDRLRATGVERLDLPLVRFKSDAVLTVAGPYRQIVTVRARIGVWRDFHPGTVHLTSALFRIAEQNPFLSRDASSIYIDARQTTKRPRTIMKRM